MANGFERLWYNLQHRPDGIDLENSNFRMKASNKISTSRQPKPNFPRDRTITVPYANDTAIACQDQQSTLVTERLQMHANRLANSYIKLKIGINADRSEALPIQCNVRHRAEQHIVI